MMTIEECEYWNNWLEDQIDLGEVRAMIIEFPNRYPGIIIEINFN